MEAPEAVQRGRLAVYPNFLIEGLTQSLTQLTSILQNRQTKTFLSKSEQMEK